MREGGHPLHERIVADLLDAIAEKGEVTPVLVAHSAQPGGVGHMNDLPLCRSIAGRLRTPDGWCSSTRTCCRPSCGRHRAERRPGHPPLPRHDLRAHGGDPALVIGWSHKYAEILDPFGLGDVAMTYDDLSDDDVVDRTLDVLARRDDIAAKITAHLPQATAEAEVNIEVLAGGPPSSRGMTAVPVSLRSNKATITHDLRACSRRACASAAVSASSPTRPSRCGSTPRS